MKAVRLLVLLALLLGLASCTQPSPTATAAAGMDAMSTPHPEPPAEYANKVNPLARDARAIENGRNTFLVYCASCHGEKGMGDGPVAASLNPRPRQLAGHAMELSDAYLYWRIAEGGMREPFMSAMPAWKDALSEQQIWEIIAFLRSLEESH